MIELLEGDTDKAKRIMLVKKDVERYVLFNRSIKLGITYNSNDLSFSRFLIYSCIKEAMKDG